eukprot:6200384-Pleurochrysis_carterae.AAC.1
MPLVGGADLNGTASGDSTDLRFNRPYRASPTGLSIIIPSVATFAQKSKLQVNMSKSKQG